MGDTTILLGYEVGTGNEVRMKIHHTVITGMTRLSGKTIALEAIINRVGSRVIAFKVKKGESSFINYREIPPFFHQRADWQYITSLLEGILQEKMRFERPWIMRATNGASTLREVYENVQALRSEVIGMTLAENVYTALEGYLKIVVPQIEKLNFSKVLEPRDGINVMDLTAMSLELQSLVICSTMENVISQLRDTIVIITEAREHLPQGRSTPVKLCAETFIRKGTVNGNYLIIDSQDLSGVDKILLRQCNNWILGRQTEGYEVARVGEQRGKKISTEEFQSLQIGHFYAILEDDTRKVYVLPDGVPGEIGRRIALGGLPSSEAVKYMSGQKPLEMGEGKPLNPEPQTDPTRVLKSGQQKKSQEQPYLKSEENDEVRLLRGEVKSLKQELKEASETLVEVLRKLNAQEQRTAHTQDQVAVNRLGFNIDDLNTLVDQRMQQIIKFEKPTTFISVDVSGSFRGIIKEKLIQNMARRIRDIPDEAVIVAMIVHEKGVIDRNELFALLSSETGEPTSAFFSLIQALVASKLVSYSEETGIVRWVLREHIEVEFSQLYDETTRRQVEEYLTSLLISGSNSIDDP
ncbi:MAG: hypothetical protein NTV15_06790 [Candidatus Bathyarchaeota archaeon]|nr:hypothetical protein [Candidatus Bathyarchaeota archaeon]